MISEVRPLSVGNALQLALRPPVGASAWRILRNGVNSFAGPDDAACLLAYEGKDYIVLDAMPGLVNEQPIYYRPYYWISGAWVAGDAAAGTPLATYGDRSTDALQLVRDRLDAGMQVEVARGSFNVADQRPIKVLTAPPPADESEPPLLTVHLESESPAARGVGEVITDDVLLNDGQWEESEGWLADVSLEILGWSLNPDERLELRKAIRRVLVANLPVFAAAGFEQVAFSASDREFLNGEFGANVYQTAFTFTCQAPVIVSAGPIPAVSDVEVTVGGEFAHP